MSYQHDENADVEVEIGHLRVGKFRRGQVVLMKDDAYLETLVRGGYVNIVNPPDWELSDETEGFLLKKDAEPISSDPLRFRIGQPAVEVAVPEKPTVEVEAEEPVTAKPYRKLTDLPKKAVSDTPEAGTENA